MTYVDKFWFVILFFNRKLILVRADISRLPFVSGSIDAVHAGAALHCWPSPSNAVSTTCYLLMIVIQLVSFSVPDTLN